MNNSHFQRGSGVFTCSACGRRTRHTGVQSVGSDLCPDDYELAGIYNEYQDGGDMREEAQAILFHTERIVAAGGTLDGDAQELLAAISDGTEGQDRESYTDTQDRQNYIDDED